jgi:hypothetical protein
MDCVKPAACCRHQKTDKETHMMQIIDLGNELLVDRSKIRLGQLRLLLAAVGRPLVAGSPWTVINKRVAEGFGPLFSATRERRRNLPAA